MKKIKKTDIEGLIGHKVYDNYENFGLDSIKNFIEENPSFVALMKGKIRKFKDPKRTAEYSHEDIIYTIGYSHFNDGGCGCCGQKIDNSQEILLLKIVDLNED